MEPEKIRPAVPQAQQPCFRLGGFRAQRQRTTHPLEPEHPLLDGHGRQPSDESGGRLPQPAEVLAGRHARPPGHRPIPVRRPVQAIGTLRYDPDGPQHCVDRRHQEHRVRGTPGRGRRRETHALADRRRPLRLQSSGEPTKKQDFMQNFIENFKR